MTSDVVIAAALESLASQRLAHREAAQLVPREPGLYAFYGDARAWSDLGLSLDFDGQPLYVGKAEKSLNGRDVAPTLPPARPALRRSGAASRLCSRASSTLSLCRGTWSSLMGAPTSDWTRQARWS